MRIPARFIGFLAVFQSILFLVHIFLYETWTFSAAGNNLPSTSLLKIVLGALSVSFLVASVLAFRHTNAVLRVFYRIAAVWLGLVSFLFFAAALSWIVFGIALLAGWYADLHRVAEVLFGMALLSGFFGVLNASLTRVRRITVRLENLPEAWRGRKAALISDLHLGHVRNGDFLRRIVAKVMKEKPDAVFVAGDLYDGTAIDAAQAAEPLRWFARAAGDVLCGGES